MYEMCTRSPRGKKEMEEPELAAMPKARRASQILACLHELHGCMDCGGASHLGFRRAGRNLQPEVEACVGHLRLKMSLQLEGP